MTLTPKFKVWLIIGTVLAVTTAAISWPIIISVRKENRWKDACDNRGGVIIATQHERYCIKRDGFINIPEEK